MLRKNSGFTFAELMVVLGIIAIISAFAIPGLIGWIPKQKLGTASRDLLSTLEAARTRAVRERVSVGLEFNATTYTVFIDNGAGGGGIADNAVRDGTEQIIRNGEMPAGHHVASWDGKDDDGQLVSSGVYFYRISTDDFTDAKKMMLLK